MQCNVSFDDDEISRKSDFAMEKMQTKIICCVIGSNIASRFYVLSIIAGFRSSTQNRENSNIFPSMLASCQLWPQMVVTSLLSKVLGV